MFSLFERHAVKQFLPIICNGILLAVAPLQIACLPIFEQHFSLRDLLPIKDTLSLYVRELVVYVWLFLFSCTSPLKKNWCQFAYLS